jgi:hypothetical protein
MSYLKENVSGIVLCLFEALVGILLMINPVGFTSAIIMAGGIVILIIGIINIINYFKTPVSQSVLSQSLTKGLIALLVGMFCIFQADWFIATFPVLTIIYGVIVLIAGLGKVQVAADMIRMKHKKWFLPAISAAISIVCAVVILENPFSTTIVLWMFTGISLIVEAVFDTITLIVNRKKS